MDSSAELAVEESVSINEDSDKVFLKADSSSSASCLSEGEGRFSKSGGNINGSFF